MGCAQVCSTGSRGPPPASSHALMPFNKSNRRRSSVPPLSETFFSFQQYQHRLKHANC